MNVTNWTRGTADQQVWRERVEDRLATASPIDQPAIATWERIQIQRTAFQPWAPGSALFIDGVAPIAHNLTELLTYITGAQPIDRQ